MTASWSASHGLTTSATSLSPVEQDIIRSAWALVLPAGAGDSTGLWYAAPGLRIERNDPDCGHRRALLRAPKALTLDDGHNRNHALKKWQLQCVWREGWEGRKNIVPESTYTAIELCTPPRDRQTELWPRRIDEVLRERKRNAAARRTRELETQSGNSQRALVGYRRMRATHLDKLASVSPELRERRGSRMKTVYAAYEAVMASNAACEALSDQSR